MPVVNFILKSYYSLQSVLHLETIMHSTLNYVVFWNIFIVALDYLQLSISRSSLGRTIYVYVSGSARFYCEKSEAICRWVFTYKICLSIGNVQRGGEVSLNQGVSRIADYYVSNFRNVLFAHISICSVFKMWSSVKPIVSAGTMLWWLAHWNRNPKVLGSILGCALHAQGSPSILGW